ncbi:MAG: hypothetical protein ED559_00300 [Phycisphaera sp.]|nr:MAG: hypothetical protein ED559_00300 [Phycisphaera sp.]
MPDAPTSPTPDASDSQSLDALPEPRSKGPVDAESSATWTEFKPSAKPDESGVESPADEADAHTLEAPELEDKPRWSVWRSLTHLSDPKERRRLARFMRRKRAILASVMVVVLGVVSIGAAISVSLARAAPSWWVDVDKASQRNIDLSNQVQNGTLTHITADRGTLIGGSVEWPVMMTDEAANAWLNIGLPDWFSKISGGMPWPESVTQIQIVFDSGTVRIGVRALTETGSRIYSCAIVPELRDDGSLWMKAKTVSMGKLTLPASWVLRGADTSAASYIPEQLRGTAQAEALFEKLTGQLPLFELAEVDLSDGRVVRLTDLRVRDGTVIALCVTRNQTE